MASINNGHESDKSTLHEELRHGKALLSVYIQRRRELELQATQYSKDSIPLSLEIDLDSTKEKIKELEHQIRQLEEVEKSFVSHSTDHNTDGNDEASFVPDWSVIRSRVRYVDANLALKYTDTAQDLDIMLGFMTLFLGSAISFIVSLAMADTPDDLALLWIAVAFSALLTIIFGILTRRAWMKAEALKMELFESGDSKQDKE